MSLEMSPALSVFGALLFESDRERSGDAGQCVVERHRRAVSTSFVRICRVEHVQLHRRMQSIQQAKSVTVQLLFRLIRLGTVNGHCIEKSSDIGNDGIDASSTEAALVNLAHGQFQP